MRKLLVVSSFLLCSSKVLAADASDGRWRISVLASEISASGNQTFAGIGGWAMDPHAGFGLGIAYVPTPQWDVEFTVASQTHRSPYTRLLYSTATSGPLGPYPVTEFRDYRVNPLDISVTRHFLVDQKIAPYVRAGVRYVDAPDDPAPVVALFPGVPEFPRVEVREGFGFDDRVSAQAGAGVRVRLTPRTALRAEGTRLIRSEAAGFDPLMRYAVGLSWMF